MQLEFDLSPQSLDKDMELENLYLSVKTQWEETQPRFRYSLAIQRAEQHMTNGLFQREVIMFELTQAQIWLKKMKEYCWHE